MKKILVWLLFIVTYFGMYGEALSLTTPNILAKKSNGFLRNIGQWDSTILFVNNIFSRQKQILTAKSCLTLGEFTTSPSQSFFTDTEHNKYSQYSIGLRFDDALSFINEKKTVHSNTHFIGSDKSVHNVPLVKTVEAFIGNNYCEITIDENENTVYTIILKSNTTFQYYIDGIKNIQREKKFAKGNTPLGEVFISEPHLTALTDKGEYKSIPFEWEIGNDGKCSIIASESIFSELRLVLTQPSFSSLLNGSNDDEASSVQVDSSRFIYVAGETNSQDFPITAGAYQTTLKNSRDCFIAKYSPDGSQLIYSTFVGGDGIDRALDIAVHNDGKVYITGSTTSDNFPLSANPFQNKRKNLDQGSDAFIAALQSDGKSLLYSSYFGGQFNDVSESIVSDKSGFIYITGKTDGPKEFPIKNAFQNVFGGGTSDGFITKFSSDLSSIIYSSFLGGELDDYPNALTVNDSGSVFVVGQTQSRKFPVTPFTVSNVFAGGIFDSFITRISNDGSSISYSALIGGSGDDIATSIITDIFDNAYVVGNSNSANFPITVIAADTSYNGKTDAYCYKLSPNGGRFLFSSFIGGTNDEYARSVSIDPCFAVYISGYTNSNDIPISDNPIQNQLGGEFDGFLTKINADGNLFVYGTYIGGSSDDKCLASTVDSTGAVTLVGYTTSANFPSQTSYKAKKDAFVTKIQVGILPLSPKINADGPLSFCAENGFVTLDVGAGYRTYQWKKNNDIIPGANSSRYTTSESGIYTIEVIDVSGCTGINSVEVRAYLPPSIVLQKKNIICPDSSVLLPITSKDSLISYRWIPTLGLSSDKVRSPRANPPVNTMYTVIVTDTNGCTTRDSLWVYVINPNSVSVISSNDILEACPNDTLAIHFALKNDDLIERNVLLTTQTARFRPQKTSYSLLSNSDTITSVKFSGNIVPGLYRDTLSVTDICGNTIKQPLTVRVGTPSITLGRAKDTTVCANEPVRRTIKVSNSGTIGSRLKLSSNNPLFSFPVDTSLVKANDSSVFFTEFKGASPGIYKSQIYTLNSCGSKDSVEITIIVEGNPIIFSLQPSTIPQTVGTTASVDINVDNTIVLDTARNKTISIVVKNERTALELIKVHSVNCSLQYTSNDSSAIISLTACRNGIKNPIATLDYTLVIGNTLQPNINFESITIGDRCIDPSSIKSTVNIKPFGCEIRTLNVELFESQLRSVSPNPSNTGHIIVDFSSVEEIPTSISLHNVIGHEIYTIDNASTQQGVYRAFIPTTGLQEGLYLISYKAGKYFATLPIIIQH
jgi:hypothetical protein